MTKTVSSNLEIKIIGRSGTRLTQIEDALLAASEFRVKRKLVVDLDSDSLAENDGVDAIILDLSDNWEKELQLLGSLRRKNDRSPTIVVGIDDDPQMLKMALKSGARDYYSHPISEVELVESILQVCEEQQLVETGAPSINVVMHGKGGAGASFFASNIAHMLASERRKEPTMLLDLNFLAGEIPLYFDLNGGGDLRQALDYIDSVDEVALQAYIMRHKSGVHVMASSGEPTEAGRNISEGSLSRLATILSSSYKQLVVDMPNPAEPAAMPLIVKADRVFIVIQQNLMDLHCTKRLITMLDFYAVSREKITIIINRFDLKNPVRYQDIQGALDGLNVACVPNDYKRVSESINAGVPLAERWSSAPVTRAIREVVHQILGQKEKPKTVFGAIRKLISSK